MNVGPTTRRWLLRCAKAVLVAGLVWAPTRRCVGARRARKPGLSGTLPRLKSGGSRWRAFVSGGNAAAALFFAPPAASLLAGGHIVSARRACYISQVGQVRARQGDGDRLRGRCWRAGGRADLVAAAVFVETLTAMAGGGAGGGGVAPTGANRPKPCRRRRACSSDAVPGVALDVRPLASLLGMRRLNPQAADKSGRRRRMLLFGWIDGRRLVDSGTVSVGRPVRDRQAPPMPLSAWPLHTAAVVAQRGGRFLYDDSGRARQPRLVLTNCWRRPTARPPRPSPPVLPPGKARVGGAGFDYPILTR